MSELKHVSLNGLRTFLKPLMRIINKKAETWEDLKEKPFESKWEEVTLMDNVSITLADLYDMGMPIAEIPSLGLAEDETYNIYYDGTLYKCQSHFIFDGESLALGNTNVFPPEVSISESFGNGEPFLIIDYGNYGEVIGETLDSTHTITVSGVQETIKKLDGKYVNIELPEGILTQDNYLETTAGKQVGDNGEVFNNYDANSASYMAHAEGSGTHADGMYSHAEGQGTEASGSHSHAEGYYTESTGDKSHAEGSYTISYGDASHAEGENNEAKGRYSHAEGNHSYAGGTASHAEGKYTNAISDSAHAEGFGLGFDITFKNQIDTYKYAYSSLTPNDSNADITKCDTLYWKGNYYNIEEINTQEQTITLRYYESFANTNGFLPQTFASGAYSHVEGLGTTTLGTGSHAEGKISKAIGEFSHAEGEGNVAIGKGSHAEGRGQYSTITLVRDGYGSTYTYSNATFTPVVGDTLYYENFYYSIESVDSSNSTITLDGTIPKSSFIALHYQGFAGGYSAHKEGNYSNASGSSSHAEGTNTYAKGQNSHAEGKETIAKGQHSHAEGENSIAKGDASHAEGRQTTANGDYSHAEGFNTNASARQSHAEGTATTASGVYSHAEGYETTANGQSSHAEGSATLADGYSCHAEGSGTKAYNYFTHAEGNGTIARGRSNHVQGEYNIEDSSIGGAFGRGTYVHIVGNGTSDTARSNAHTLDWNGNAWFAGNIYVGGTSQNNADRLLKNSEVFNKLNIINNELSIIKAMVSSLQQGISILDPVTDYTHIVSIQNGELVTSIGTEYIEIISQPIKTSYMDGDIFDPTGITVIAHGYDGSSKEITDLIYSDYILSEGMTSIELLYFEGGIKYEVGIINITVSAFDPTIALIDFTYNDNGDGTYTITGWNNTYNGDSSVKELIIPNNTHIVL